MKKLCLLANANSIHTQKWVEYFSNLDYEIDIITLTDTDHSYKPNVKVHFIKPISSNKFSYFLEINKVKKLVNKIRPDLIHSHYASSYGMLGRMSGYHPFIVSVWGSDVYEFPEKNPLNKILLKYILKGADAVCSTSIDMKNVTNQYYKGNILVTPFGVDVEQFHREKKIFSRDYITIGVTKSLEDIYGIKYLVEGFSIALNRVKKKDIRLLIVGDGKQKKNLEELCNKLGIRKKVDFIGSVSNEKMPHYINEMDIVCIPSLRESFGVSAIEAAACERPVIASNIGGLKEIIIDGKTGFLVEAMDSEMIAEKIETLVNNIELSKELGENGRKLIVNKFSWNDNTKIMQNLYESIIDK